MAYCRGDHHHHRCFDYRAGVGASSTSVGPLPGSWLAADIADRIGGYSKGRGSNLEIFSRGG